MLKKVMLLALIFVGILNAANLNLNKNTYNPNEQIRVHFSAMAAKNKDWIAIYPENSNNEWDNVKRWTWTNDKASGDLVFQGLPAGNYEVRAFYNNSYHTEARKKFRVGVANAGATVTTNKDNYNQSETVTATFNHMSGNNKDWIAIYKAGTNNEWKNVVDWDWTDGKVQGSKSFHNLAKGNYEVRVFFRNSFHVEARHAFKVGGANGGAATVTTNKASYNQGQTVTATYNHMSGSNNDWIAIYKAGTNNEWKNVVDWAWIRGKAQGSQSFRNLPAGNYEVRVFFRNTFNLEAKHAFKVVAVHHEPRRIVYDTFEHGGIDPRWIVSNGKPLIRLNYGVNKQQIANGNRKVKIQGQHSIRLTNSDHIEGTAAYYFDFQHPGREFKYLDLDMSIGQSSHRFKFGVYVATKDGNRQITFASYYNHTTKAGKQIIRGPYRNVLPNHIESSSRDNGYDLTYAAPTDYYVGTSKVGAGENKFVHYKINIEAYLKKLQPNNELYEILAFYAEGGDYDNLALTNY